MAPAWTTSSHVEGCRPRPGGGGPFPAATLVIAMMDPHTDYQQPEREEGAERQPVPPIESRFMFVDVAALRAKQLRRGALPRIPLSPDQPHKLERVAMEEVRRGLVEYMLPDRRPGEQTTAP